MPLGAVGTLPITEGGTQVRVSRLWGLFTAWAALVGCGKPLPSRLPTKPLYPEEGFLSIKVFKVDTWAEQHENLFHQPS